MANRLGRHGGRERGELTREVAEDHQIGSCYGFRGVNLVLWLEVLMIETEKGVDFDDGGGSDGACWWMGLKN